MPKKRLKKKKPKALLSPAQEHKLEGKFVALSNGHEKKVIAFADTYSDLLKEVKKTVIKTAFCIISLPKQGVLYSH